MSIAQIGFTKSHHTLSARHMHKNIMINCVFS